MAPAIEILIDVDTGVDDALALSFAALHPAINLRAVTCVAGNTSLDNVYRNTRAVLAVAGAGHVPVARGASRPLIAAPRDAAHVHGHNGLAGLELAVPEGGSDIHAVELMRREILASPTPPTLIALAPLTNVALLLRMYPDVAARLGRIVFMGGSASIGNATPVAEFNSWADPEAVAIVVDSGIPTMMYGLDVFYSAAVSEDDVATLERSSRPVAQLCAKLFRHMAVKDSDQKRIPDGTIAALGDAGTVCAVVDPAGLTTRRFPVSVCTDGARSRGQTIVDRRSHRGESELNGASLGQPVDVALAVDGARFAQLFRRTILEG
ncbi:nucleoside hydrolase [Aminobacter sp. MET-1]|uniref:nucleoside hydrolase n=1 Tax=Aminobacter sp. MET-1 TaxID=2951085 RepID=UPI00226A4514|nr:nucleoside hydrolase [Aminobacter sp. MET-1]MCX8570576.1 nucleoside hydrolase [Aminobacter sp. MET-1]